MRRILLAAALVVLLLWPGRLGLAEFTKWRSRAALEQRRPEPALQWLGTAEWLVPGDAEVAFLKARAYRRQGRFEQSRDHLLRAWNGGFPVERLQREQWLAQAQAGQLREAEPHLPRLLTDPLGDVSEICEAYVTGYIRTHRVGDALRILDSWAADEPRNPLPLLMRGKLYIEIRQWTESRQALEEALRLDPGCHEAACYLADALVELRQIQDAEALYRQCAADVADSQLRDRAVFGRTRCLRMMGRSEEAQRLLESLAAETPDHVPAMIELARIEFDSGRFAEALRLLEKAGVGELQDIEARYILAGALRGAGRTDDAQAHFDWIRRAQAALARAQGLTAQILKQHDDVEARHEAGRIFLEFGDREKGVLWLQSVLNYAPDHAPTHAILAEYYERRAAREPKFAELARRHRRQAGGPSITIERRVSNPSEADSSGPAARKERGGPGSGRSPAL